jgi:hypothetical protein
VWYPRGMTGPRSSPQERFEARVDRDAPEGCWVWLGHRNENGYGRMMIDGRMKYAHRVAYELLVGPIPENKTLDHLCRNTSCVNPEHLEPVTLSENVTRANSVRELATHCKNNHPFDEVNTGSQGADKRRCRACHRDKAREYRRQKKENQS